MNITNNWKYEEWANEMKKSPYDTSYDIQRYINYEIYAEDIEIISTILLPITFEYKGLILLDREGGCEEEVRDNFDSGLLNIPDMTELQESMNRLIVRDVFFNTADKSSDSTIMNVAKLIQHNWTYYLIKEYPSRRFKVEIVGEDFYPVVTFYEVP